MRSSSSTMQEIFLVLLWLQLSSAFFTNSVALKSAKRETACLNKRFSLKCNLQCSSTSAIFTWTKLPDTCIQSNEKYEVDSMEGKFDIHQVTEMDSGYYECVAGNQQAYFYLETKECYDIPNTDISIFEDARCVICPTQTPATIEFTEKPKGQSVCLGSIVPLYCGVSRWDTAEIYWYKDDQLLNERPIRSARTGLIIYDFAPDHCACYKCVVKFPGGSIEAIAELTAQ